MKSLNLLPMVLFTIIMSLSEIHAQPDTLWTKFYNDGFSSLLYGGLGTMHQETNDGGYILIGPDYDDKDDGNLFKTDEFGDTLWTRRYGGAELDVIHWVEQTNDYGYIFTGYTYSFGADWDIWLTKTDQFGDTLWTRILSDSGYGVGRCVKQINNGGYIVCGMKGTGNPDLGDVCLVKTDSDGNTLWVKTYDSQINDSLNYDEGCSVQQTQDGGYIIVGSKNWYYLWLIKTDQNGDTLWTKTYDVFCQYGSLQQTSDNGFIVLTNTGWLIKTDALGDTLWSRNYGSFYGSFNWDEARDVKQTRDGGFIITGIHSPILNIDHMFVIKTDPLGHLQWDFKMQFPESDHTQGHSVLQSQDGYYSVAGYNEGPEGQWGTFLMKIDRGKMIAGFGDRSPSTQEFHLRQNYPNPFNPSTIISWQLAVSSPVKLTVYNLSGQKIVTLVDKHQPSGDHSIQFDGSGLASGIYLYRLQVGDFIETRKMMLMK